MLGTFEETKLQPQLRIKIVLVGDVSTGKTSIKNRFCGQVFYQFSNPTVGVQLASRNFWSTFQDKQQIYQMVFWDIGAGLYDQTILPTFFRNALGIIYVYDMTKNQTFQRLNYWRDIVKKHMNSQNYTEMIIGNKGDLMHFREVNGEQVKKWAISNRIRLYYETSALQGIYILEAMQSLAKNIIQKFDESVRPPIKLNRKQAHHRSCI